MLQVLRGDPDAHEAFLLDELSGFVFPEIPVLMIRGLVACRCHTHGTFFVLERSVAVSSPGHGGQVSVSPFPRFHSVVLP